MNISQQNDFVQKIAAQIRADSRDVIGDKCIKDDHGNLSVTTDAKKEAWKKHYGSLLNVEFPSIHTEFTK